jgi:hypothetical protein
MVWASTAAESRCAVTIRKRARLVRPSSARAWSQTRGARKVSRKLPAIACDQRGGMNSATTARKMHPASAIVSRREYV